MHLLIGAKPGLLNTFFSLVKKRLCSPGPKHCLNVEAVVLCTLGMCVRTGMLYGVAVYIFNVGSFYSMHHRDADILKLHTQDVSYACLMIGWCGIVSSK